MASPPPPVVSARHRMIGRAGMCSLLLSELALSAPRIAQRSDLPPAPSSLPPPVTRRVSAIATVAILLSSVPYRVHAGSPFDKYIKRKKLDPLETYIPAVILTEAQFKDLEKFLELEQPQFDIGRSLLRSGPASSLRVNIRAELPMSHKTPCLARHQQYSVQGVEQACKTT